LARLTRHEILKEDRFLLSVEKIRDFFLNRRKPILLGLGTIALVTLLGLGWSYNSARQNERAKDELSQALKIYHSPVVTATQGQGSASPKEPTFNNSAKKYEEALAEFQKVSHSYSSRPAGKIAKYYAGLCLMGLNRNNEAIAILEPLSKEKSDYGTLARVVLAEVYEKSGNLSRATETYQRIVDDGSPIAPKNASMMHLAGLYEQQNKKNEAAKIYQQVVKDFPGTPFFIEAEQKIKQLSQ
jgi:tetratricopeptide (TPR) repeat protein